MFKIKKSTVAALLTIVSIAISGCSLAQTMTPVAPTSTPPPLPTVASSTPTPTALASGNGTGLPVTSSTPQTGNIISTPVSAPRDYNAMRGSSACNLINSQNLASLFPPHNEVVKDIPKSGPVSHPPFSDTQAAGTETECTFYDFHKPGQDTGWMLQVVYLVDVPAASTESTWKQAWTAAKEKSGQTIQGLGDEAFTNNTNLYISLGNTYLTFEASDTHVDEKTASGQQQLISYEKQLATDALNNLK